MTPRDANGMESIPGMGIIRARTLRKAGIPDIEALRKMTLEELAAVPGITEVKARQILEFVAERKQPHAEQTERPQKNGVSTEADRRSLADQMIAEQLREFSATAAALLSSESASGFDRRLARQLGKIAALRGALTGSERVESEDSLRCRACVRKMGKALTELLTSERPGHRAQEKIADRLRDARKSLTAILMG